jgi:hypothetical protein
MKFELASAIPRLWRFKSPDSNNDCGRSMNIRTQLSLLRCTIACAAVGIILAGGCGGEPERPAQSDAELLEARKVDDATIAALRKSAVDNLVTRMKQRYDDFTAGKTKEPPVVNLLVISGGGDWGAFGAGVLTGWAKVPPGPMARPQFDAVTGVSTGALIAPFAFVGTDESYAQINHLYRHPDENWAVPRAPFFFWPSNPSFIDMSGLEKELDKSITMQLLQQIVDASQGGRLLAINTTDVDFGDSRPWDIGAEAKEALASGKTDRVKMLLLASSAIPGAFPSRQIKGQLYVDGAITGNILYGGRVEEEDSFQAEWKEKYPDIPVPATRYWVIFNNQFRFPPQVTQPKWPAVIGRSTIMATQSATITSMRHLFAMAEISKLKRGADVQVRVMAVPDGWKPPEEGTFKPKVMNALADMGEQMGADPNNWITEAP